MAIEQLKGVYELLLPLRDDPRFSHPEVPREEIAEVAKLLRVRKELSAGEAARVLNVISKLWPVEELQDAVGILPSVIKRASEYLGSLSGGVSLSDRIPLAVRLAAPSVGIGLGVGDALQLQERATVVEVAVDERLQTALVRIESDRRWSLFRGTGEYFHELNNHQITQRQRALERVMVALATESADPSKVVEFDGLLAMAHENAGGEARGETGPRIASGHAINLEGVSWSELVSFLEKIKRYLDARPKIGGIAIKPEYLAEKPLDELSPKEVTQGVRLGARGLTRSMGLPNKVEDHLLDLGDEALLALWRMGSGYVYAAVSSAAELTYDLGDGQPTDLRAYLFEALEIISEHRFSALTAPVQLLFKVVVAMDDPTMLVQVIDALFEENNSAAPQGPGRGGGGGIKVIDVRGPADRAPDEDLKMAQASEAVAQALVPVRRGSHRRRHSPVTADLRQHRYRVKILGGKQKPASIPVVRDEARDKLVLSQALHFAGRFGLMRVMSALLQDGGKRVGDSGDGILLRQALVRAGLDPDRTLKFLLNQLHLPNPTDADREALALVLDLSRQSVEGLGWAKERLARSTAEQPAATFTVAPGTISIIPTPTGVPAGVSGR